MLVLMVACRCGEIVDRVGRGESVEMFDGSVKGVVSKIPSDG
jgi:hypothetical protein